MPGDERILDISEAAAHLSVRHEQLIVRPEGAEEASVPLSDLAVIVLSHRATEDSSDVIRKTIRAGLPSDGQVRLLMVTDRQFGKMEVFYGRKRHATEDPPAQIMLF